MEGLFQRIFLTFDRKFESEMTTWLKTGQIKYHETTLKGFERAPEGLVGLFHSRNTGKMLVKVAGDASTGAGRDARRTNTEGLALVLPGSRTD
jgi:hypothetical protein